MSGFSHFFSGSQISWNNNTYSQEWQDMPFQSVWLWTECTQIVGISRKLNPLQECWSLSWTSHTSISTQFGDRRCFPNWFYYIAKGAAWQWLLLLSSRVPLVQTPKELHTCAKHVVCPGSRVHSLSFPHHYKTLAFRDYAFFCSLSYPLGLAVCLGHSVKSKSVRWVKEWDMFEEILRKDLTEMRLGPAMMRWCV